ncbi:MAG: MFS family permease [Planctomycetota bacterium]
MLNDRPILLLAIAQTLVWACLYYSFPALLLQWEEAFGWSRADLTAAITLAIIVSAIAAPVSGRIIDAGKAASMMALASFCGGLCLLLLTQVEQLWQFYLVWGGIGLCMSGALYEPCFSLITRARGDQAKSAITTVTLIAGFAGTISFPLANRIESAFGWQTAIVVFALTCMLLVTPLIWLGANALEQSTGANSTSHASPAGTDKSFLRSPVFFSLAIGFSLAAVLHGVTLHHLLPILDERAVDAALAVLVVSSIGPMQVAGRLVMIVANRYVSNHGVTIACFILMGASIVVLILSEKTPALLFLFVLLFGGSYGIVSIIRPVIARDLLGQHQFGAKSGAMALVYLSGSASAPLLGALLWSWAGYTLVLPVLIGFAITGLGLYLYAHSLAK